MSWFLSVRTDTRGGSVGDVQVLRNDPGAPILPAIQADAAGKHLFIATHGFNVNQPDGMEHLSYLSRLLQLNDSSLFIGFLWPGDSRWISVLEYVFAARDAMRSAEKLADFVN